MLEVSHASESMAPEAAVWILLAEKILDAPHRVRFGMLRLCDRRLEPLLRFRKLGANALQALHMPPVQKAIRSTTFQYYIYI